MTAAQTRFPRSVYLAAALLLATLIARYFVAI